MNKLSYVFYRTMLWLWDIISLNLVLFLVSYFVDRAQALEQQPYHVFFAVINLAWMASVYITGLYLAKDWLDFEGFYKRTIKAYLFTLLILFAFIFLYHFPYSRLYILLVIAGFAALLTFNRIVFNILIFFLRSKFRLQKNVVVVGYNDLSKRLIRYFNEESKFVHVAGCFEDRERLTEEPNYPIAGGIKDIMPFVIENNVTEIYSTLAPEHFPDLYELAKQAE
ncbi:MAG TPA: hypothetical protein VIK80_11920, partial [Flavihumibacter sp.]